MAKDATLKVQPFKEVTEVIFLVRNKVVEGISSRCCTCKGHEGQTEQDSDSGDDVRFLLGDLEDDLVRGVNGSIVNTRCSPS